MKLLLVLGSDDVYNRIAWYVEAMGFELIRYRYVLKTMDNIDEVDPTAIIMSARDFPLHWKVFLQFVRGERSKEVCPVIILKGDNFPLEEASKAFYLGVNGLVAESLDSPLEIDRLQSLLSNAIPLDKQYRLRRYYEEAWNRFGLVLLHPLTRILITGSVKGISHEGVSFYPHCDALMKGITVHTELPECSLRVGDAKLSPVCKLLYPGRIVILEFLSFPPKEQAILDAYLQGITYPITRMNEEQDDTTSEK
jgi:hypothetical protein